MGREYGNSKLRLYIRFWEKNAPWCRGTLAACKPGFGLKQRTLLHFVSFLRHGNFSDPEPNLKLHDRHFLLSGISMYLCSCGGPRATGTGLGLPSLPPRSLSSHLQPPGCISTGLSSKWRKHPHTMGLSSEQRVRGKSLVPKNTEASYSLGWWVHWRKLFAGKKRPLEEEPFQAAPFEQ